MAVAGTDNCLTCLRVVKPKTEGVSQGDCKKGVLRAPASSQVVPSVLS